MNVDSSGEHTATGFGTHTMPADFSITVSSWARVNLLLCPRQVVLRSREVWLQAQRGGKMRKALFGLTCREKDEPEIVVRFGTVGSDACCLVQL